MCKYDGLYDLDGDGQLDPFEMALMMKDCENEEDNDFDDEAEDEIEAAGLDKYDLEFMSDRDRREALEDAGLDPDDYDEDFD